MAATGAVRFVPALPGARRASPYWMFLHPQRQSFSTRGAVASAKGAGSRASLLVEYRNTQGPDRYPALDAELMALSPDLVVAAGPQAAVALKSANSDHSDCIRSCGRSRRTWSGPLVIKSLGLNAAPSLLVRADEVIE